MNPLESDVKRQAIPTLRGYSYQIWQSVLRWIDLKENQKLFLEGAEDIDLHGPGQVETIQVKNTAQSVTLNSKDVVDAINNFWKHQSNHSDIKIKFRFLTTSERGIEKENSFNGIKGLDFWDSRKYPGTDVSLLRNFLKSQKKFDDELSAFITNSRDEDLREKLILPIEWDTGKNVQSYIEEIIERKVVEHGDRVNNLSPSESKKVIPHLLQHVWEVACKEDDRWLSKYDLLTLFENSTMELVSKQRIREIEKTARDFPNPSMNLFAGKNQSSSLDTNWGIDSVIEPFSPPDMSQFLEREEIVKIIRDKINETGIVVLTGSTGMGKSILSYQLASSTEGNWRRIDLRGFKPEQVRDRLHLASKFIGDNSNRVDLIIDDLNFDEGLTVYETALAKLIFISKNKNGRITITSHNSLPIRVSSLSNVSQNCSISIPRLSEDEVKNLLSIYGCPKGYKLKAWSKIIFLKTLGHPLLCHMRIKNSSEENWENPNVEEILFSENDEDIKKEFRRLLNETLPLETRSLLYRLTIFNLRFKRKQALDMGKHQPMLSMPGEVFDKLIGPWVEPIDDKYFRISPLVSDSARAVFTDEEIKALHKVAGESFLEKSIGPYELEGLLYHGLIGEAENPLIAATNSINTIPRNEWKSIAKFLDWFAKVKLKKGERIFPKNDFINYLLRRLQLKIGAEIDPQTTVEIGEIIEHEIDNWNTDNVIFGTKEMIEFAFLSEVLFEVNVPFSIKKIVGWTFRLLSLSKTHNKFFPEHPEFQKNFKSKLLDFDFADVYAQALVGRCRSPENVVELLTKLNESTDSLVEEIWNVFRTDNYATGTLVDAVWLREAEKSNPNWTNCLETLDWIIELSLRKKVDYLGIYAFNAKSIVYEEYIRNTDEALNMLDEGQKIFPNSKFILEDYRAKIHFFKKQYQEALDIWRIVLPKLQNDKNTARTFTFREAQICASKLGKWEEVAGFALMGEKVSRLPINDSIPTEEFNTVLSDVIAVGFRADYAYAKWKLEDKETTVNEFFDILKCIEKLPEPQNDRKVDVLQRRVCHAIGWFSGEFNKENLFPELPIACFSNSEITEEMIEEMNNRPIQPLIMAWCLLAKLECRMQLGNMIFAEFEKRQEKLALPLIKIGYGELKIKHGLLKLEVNDLVTQFLNYSSVMTEYANSENPEISIWNQNEILKYLTYSALILAFGKGKQDLIPLKKWTQDASNSPDLDNSILDWFNYIEDSLELDSAKLSQILNNGEELYEKRIIAALILSYAKNVGVNTRFCANLMLVTTSYTEIWENEVENEIESIIIIKWQEILKSQRFDLRSPNVFAEPISLACSDNQLKGLRKSAKILFEAEKAVSVNISQNIIDNLKLLSKT